jgi:UDP-N-acetylmuramoylalanine--D-glutamate ligase
MDLVLNSIGIWGFGIVGKSVADYLHSKGCKLEILEKRNLTDLEQEWLKARNISSFNQSVELENFLERNDIIIPSPGIDLSNFLKYKDKFLSELDIFALNFNKPVIAITGTLGKTSTTHLLTKLFCMQGIRAVAAGNIGLGMCNLLYKQNDIDLVVLEVSSFQLEQSTLLKPKISIWTNFYPNHLDWHKDIKSYFDAKFKIMLKQDVSDNALLPFNLLSEVYLTRPACNINFFTTNKVVVKDFEILKSGDSLFFIEENNIYKYSNGTKEFIYSVNDLPEISFIENWLIICATFNLYLGRYIFTQSPAHPERALRVEWITTNGVLDIPEHRLEKFAQFGSIEFYNDSKSTVGESTLAAVSKFQPDDLILFLGGLSKGVDRSKLVNNLKGKVKTIICFGAEAALLKNFCDLNSIVSYECATLLDAVKLCKNVATHKDKILFSPAGSSYDLFSNYQERGKIFKELINKYW